MSLSLHIAPQIRAFAKAAGRQFTNAEVNAIEISMNAVASLDGAGQVNFNLGRGPVGQLDAAIEMMSVGMGAVVTASSSKTNSSIAAGSSATERAVSMNAAIRTGADALKRDQAAALVQTYGNPWATGNRTHMAYVANTHPTLASRLRREAGVAS